MPFQHQFFMILHNHLRNLFRWDRFIHNTNFKEWKKWNIKLIKISPWLLIMKCVYFSQLFDEISFFIIFLENNCILLAIKWFGCSVLLVESDVVKATSIQTDTLPLCSWFLVKASSLKSMYPCCNVTKVFRYPTLPLPFCSLRMVLISHFFTFFLFNSNRNVITTTCFMLQKKKFTQIDSGLGIKTSAAQKP